MGRMMILNGSPRASKSNSREFAQLLKRSYPGATLYLAIGVVLSVYMHSGKDMLFA